MNTPRLSAQAAIIGVGRLLNMAAAAATLMVLARVLPNKATYGAVCQLIVLYMVLSQIFAVGLPQSVYYFMPRYSGAERRGFLWQTILLLTASGVLLGTGLYLGAEAIGRQLGSPLLPALLRIFALYPIFMLPTLVVEGMLLFQQRPVAAVTFNAAVRIGMFCSLVIPTLLHAELPTTIRMWMTTACLLWCWALWLIFASVHTRDVRWHVGMLRDEWKFSAPLAFSTFLVVSAAYVDRFLVSHVFGSAAFGVYTNATVEIPTVSMVTNATAVVLTAEFSRRTSAGDHGAVMPIWNNAMIRSGIWVFGSLGFLAFWGYETMRLFFSERFAESGMIFSIYVWGIPALMLTTQSLFISLGATYALIIFSAVNLVAEVVCVLIGGRLFGLAGMAIGAVVCRYLLALLSVHWYTHWLTKIGWREFLPWRMLAFILVVALASGFLSYVVKRMPFLHQFLILDYAVGLAIFCAVYVFALRRMHLFSYAIPARLFPGKIPESSQGVPNEE